MVTGPFVVIEGADGAGKTTLANAFVELGWNYAHCGPPEKPAYEAWCDALRAAPTPAVIDRLHVGSFVYGKAFRKQDDMSPFERWLFDGVLIAANTVMVWAKPPTQLLERTLDRAPEDDDAAIYEAADKRQLVRDLYEEFFDPKNGHTAFEPWVYDYSVGDESYPRFFAKSTTSIINSQPRPTFSDRAHVIGNQRSPKFIFVGDQPHCRARAIRRAKSKGLNVARYEQLAAMMYGRDPSVFNSPSGEYLYRALLNTGLTLNDYCVINSVQHDGTPIGELIENHAPLFSATVVALGKNAATELRRAGIPIDVEVPHPQYVKRFHFKRGLTEYPKALIGESPWL